MTQRGGVSLSIIIWRIGGEGPSFLLPWDPKILLAALITKQLGLAAWNYSFLNLISLYLHLFILFNVFMSISSYNLVVTAAYMYRHRPSTLIIHRVEDRYKWNSVESSGKQHNSHSNSATERQVTMSQLSSGADPGFQVMGGGAQLNIFLGYFVWKITILRPKNHIFFKF